MFFQRFNSAACCVALVTIAMVTQLGFSRSIKKQHAHGGRRHLDIDDSFDPDWSSVRSVDDVASWFSLFEDNDQDSIDKDETLHQHDVIVDDSSSTMMTKSSSAAPTTTAAATTTNPTTAGRQARSKHATRKTTTTTTVPTPSTPVPSTPTASSVVTLKGILDVRGVEEDRTNADSEESNDDDDNDEEQHQDEIELFDDPCRGVYCRAGRVCKPNKSGRRHGVSARGRCVCADADHCASTIDRHHQQQQQRHHLVCGSDGSWYPSHCELHRIACISGVHISVDRSSASCASVSPDTTTRSDKTTSGKPSEIETEVMTSSPANSSAASGLEAPRDCTESKFERMKTSLLAYHCARDTTYDCGADAEKKRLVVADMFDYYDWSGDNRLETNEMVSVEQRDHLDRLSQHCRLEDMLIYSDENKDGFIGLAEFYAAFGIEVEAKQERTPEVFKTTVSFGNSVELKCDSTGENGHVTWKRNGNDLSELQGHHIKVFADGSLYIGQLTLHHIGNYTCQTDNKNDVIQTHVLLVQMPPKVEVNPQIQRHIAGSTATLRCRANGLPTPQVSWESNETPLSSAEDASGHSRYYFMHNNSTLEVKSWLDESANSATYKCVAKNLAGASQESGTVFIERDVAANYLTADSKPAELVAVFHQRGYTVYELNRCHVDHEVSAEFQPIIKVPGGSQSSTPDSMCSSNCSWSEAVNVRGKFIYAAQPELNRIVVIEVIDRLNPVEVIITDNEPVSLQYVEHLDQVWVSCKTGDVVVAMVIRDASENVIHHAVHVHSDSGFNQVSGLFLPSSNDLAYSSDIGYASSTGKTSLQRIDLVSISYVGDIDLSDHMCVPVHLVFLPIGGRVVISCASPDDLAAEPKKQLVLDYVTDKVIETLELAGKPFVSPDLRSLVILSSAGKTLSVYAISEDGTMTHSFDEHTEMRLSHVTFFPSVASHGYTAYAASSEHLTVLQLDLVSGRVQLIKGAEQSQENADTRTAVIVSGSGQFAGHVVTLADNSVIVIDGARHHVDCEWQGVATPRLVVSLAGYK